MAAPGPKAWKCPSCRRTFGRKNQSHVCAPAMTVEEWFVDRPPAYRAVYDAVVKHLQKVGPVVVEAVVVGILIKRSRTFAELRPRRDRIVLSVILPAAIDHPRISRALSMPNRRAACFVDLRAARDVDRDVKGWLTESYLASPP